MSDFNPDGKKTEGIKRKPNAEKVPSKRAYLARQIAFSAFSDPYEFNVKMASRDVIEDGATLSSGVKPIYSLNVEKKDNGDIVLSGKDFGDVSVTITKEEQLQYISYWGQLIENNERMIIQEEKKYLQIPKKYRQNNDIAIFNTTTFNNMTGKNEIVGLFVESENLLADAVEMANKVVSSISSMKKITQNDYIAKNTQRVDDFFNAFGLAEKNMSSSNRARFQSIMKEAFDECRDYGSTNYRFDNDNKLPIDNLSNKIRKIRKQKTDDVLLKDCLRALRETTCDENLFLIAEQYFAGEKEEARKKAEILKTKYKAPSADEKSENKNSGRQMAEQALKNLYLATAANNVYHRLSSCCIEPDGSNWRKVEIADATPVNFMEEIDELTKKCSQQLTKTNKRIRGYELKKHRPSCSIDQLNHDVAQMKSIRSNEKAYEAMGRRFFRS